MSTKIDAFISEVRNAPRFVEASASNPSAVAGLASLELGLLALDRRADDSPQMIEILDKVESVISRRHSTIKRRLLEVGRLLTEARDSLNLPSLN
jgi:hypothetical protein